MTTLHVECPTGLAGDMLLSALFDLGVPQTSWMRPWRRWGGLIAIAFWSRRVAVVVFGAASDRRKFEPDLPHRHWEDLRQQFELADWSPALKRRVLAVFTALAEAEASVHGLPSDRALP